MASPAHFFSLSVNDVVHEDVTEHSPPAPPKPLSGPGTSRQTRRLQLRNAGFRATAVPTRKVTPKSVSTSTNWSSVSGLPSGSDAENMSPSGAKAETTASGGRRRSSSILQEISHATLTKPRKSRPRVPSAKFFDPVAESYDAAFTSPMSPPPPRSSIKARSTKTRAKVNPKGRRSISGEARMYIDHLEAELASAQSQLSAVNSPSVTREQSSKLRTLNAETRQLQEEVAEWEAKYDHRVQEETDRHCDIESGLRAHVRKLEDEVLDAKYRVEQLEAELDVASQTLEAAETANVNLEKRLEIMSELLAASPTKIDLHAETSSQRKKHRRQRSMLPRFPTASSLMHSPERQPVTQPTSPLLTFTNLGQDVVKGAGHGLLSLHTSFSQSDDASDAESVFSEAPATGDSMTSAEPLDGMPNFNPWTLQAIQNARARPVRRMRRFGAGSPGPKPLILPSTSHYGHNPVSAPPLERSETTPAFSFRFPSNGAMQEEDDSPSSMVSRRSASTTADETTMANFAASSFLSPHDTQEAGDESMLSVLCPYSAESQATMRNFSSLGSASGRNLMEELCAVRTTEAADDGEPQSDLSREEEQDASRQTVGSLPYEWAAEEDADAEPPIGAEVSTSQVSTTTTPFLYHSGSISNERATATPCSACTWDRLRQLFGDLWRSPVSLARRFVQTAQARRRNFAPLRNLQWWLVGALLGPIARRRMLHNPAHCRANEERQMLLSPSLDDNGLMYGTMDQTPLSSPRRAPSGHGKKRVCVRPRSKHSPWLWLRFSITLAFAVGVAFKNGPGSLLRARMCGCERKEEDGQDAAAALC